MNSLRLSRSSGASAKPKLTYTQCPIPVPSQSELLIRVKASKLNPSDILNAAGGFPKTTYPRTPGRDFAGIVEKSPGDERLIGKKVFGTSGSSLGFTRDGAHADYLVISRSAFAEMPESLSFEEASCVGVVYTTALSMVRKAALPKSAPCSVLIIGESGNVGSAIRDLIEVQYPNAKTTPANRVGGHMVLPSDDKFDVIFSCVPSTPTLQDAFGLLATKGTFIFIAASRPDPGHLTLNPLQFYRDELTISGVNSGFWTLEEAANMMIELGAMFSSGQLRMNGMDKLRTMNLRDGEQAYEAKQNVVFTT